MFYFRIGKDWRLKNTFNQTTYVLYIILLKNVALGFGLLTLTWTPSTLNVWAGGLSFGTTRKNSLPPEMLLCNNTDKSTRLKPNKLNKSAVYICGERVNLYLCTIWRNKGCRLPFRTGSPARPNGPFPLRLALALAVALARRRRHASHTLSI
jgi:hypothetical protein